MLRAPAVQCPGAAHPLQGGVEPEGQENPGIGGRAARLALDRLDRLVEGGQVEALHVRPHDARPVVLRQQAFQVDRPHADLGPVGFAHPRAAALPDRLDGRRHGGHLKQPWLRGSDFRWDIAVCRHAPLLPAVAWEVERIPALIRRFLHTL